MIKKQKGFALAETLAAIAVIGVLLASWGYYEWKIKAPQEVAASGAAYVDTLSESSMSFYLDNRRWPNDLTELSTTVHYYGEETSPYGTAPVFSIAGELLSLSVDTGSKGDAAGLKAELAGRGISTVDMTGSVVSMYMNEPNENSIQSYFLARREVPGCPSCNTMEADIDANGHDISQVRNLNGDSAEFDSAEYESAIIDELTSQSIKMAGVTLSGNGNRLDVNASEVNITGDIQGTRGTFDQVNATRVVGDDFIGDDFETGVSSVNKNKEELDQFKAQWNVCVTEGNCK